MTTSGFFDESQARLLIRFASRLNQSNHAGAATSDAMAAHVAESFGGDVVVAVGGDAIEQGWQTCITGAAVRGVTARAWSRVVQATDGYAAVDPTLERIAGQLGGSERICVARAGVVGDDAWYASDWYRRHLQPAGLDDCLFVLASTAQQSRYSGLILFRTLTRGRVPDSDRAMLGLLAEEVDGFIQPSTGTFWQQAAGLSPRLRETLGHLLGEHDRKAIAIEMGIKEHTVHDYIKSVYRHFDVHSRPELMAKSRT